MDRRQFLKLNSAALAGIAFPTSFHDMKALLETVGKREPKIKSVVVLLMVGGPSQIETFDYKPELIKSHGKTIKGFLSEKGQDGGRLARPITKFEKRGKSGQWVSDLFPNISNLVDDLAFVKSLCCDSLNHSFAQIEFLTGTSVPGNPFAGAWINYALKKESSALPQSIVMYDPTGNLKVKDYAYNFSNLPIPENKLIFKTVEDCKSVLNDIAYNKKSEYAEVLQKLAKVNASSQLEFLPRSVLKQRNQAFDSFFSMKDTLRKLIDVDGVNQDEVRLYGLNHPMAKDWGEKLITARKLIENGVTYIQLNSGAPLIDDWDQHFRLSNIYKMARKTDRPIYGFIQDLKRRGLFDSTLILWGGEFGRTPVIDTRNPERDDTGRPHNNLANTIWLTGGGIKGGISLGETDELGIRAVRDKVIFADVWATVLYMMGIDHRRLEFTHDGVEMRFIKKSGRVLHEILV